MIYLLQNNGALDPGIFSLPEAKFEWKNTCFGPCLFLTVLLTSF